MTDLENVPMSLQGAGDIGPGADSAGAERSGVLHHAGAGPQRGRRLRNLSGSPPRLQGGCLVVTQACTCDLRRLICVQHCCTWPCTTLQGQCISSYHMQCRSTIEQHACSDAGNMLLSHISAGCRTGLAAGEAGREADSRGRQQRRRWNQHGRIISIILRLPSAGECCTLQHYISQLA